MGKKIGKVIAKSISLDGHVIGENHHRAKLTDHDVELIIELAKSGMQHSEIAEKFEVSRCQVQKIAAYRSREQTAIRSRRVRDD